jgi:alpha-ribazole phosphatase
VQADDTRWWWVRHAPVPDNGRIYGQSDLDCDCSDGAVFEGLGHALPQGAVWLTSNLKRTHQTAAAIMAATEGRHDGGQPVPIPEFAEQHLGEWQGLVRHEFHAARGPTAHAFWLAPAHERAPGGESFEDLAARVTPAVDRLTAEHRGRDIIAVTHGGTIKAALSLALGIPAENALAFAIDNCSITRLDHLGASTVQTRWRVITVNQRPWLQAGATPRAVSS